MVNLGFSKETTCTVSSANAEDGTEGVDVTDGVRGTSPCVCALAASAQTDGEGNGSAVAGLDPHASSSAPVGEQDSIPDS